MNKSEIRNPKSETSPNIENPNAENQNAAVGRGWFWTSMIGTFEFVSDFGFRISDFPIWLGVLLVSGCATYHPEALPTHPDLTRLPALTVPSSRLDLPGLKPHPFDPAKGLDETSVITLAVLDNPGLKAVRLQAGVAEAQLLEAGLLPDPVVSGGIAQSTLHTGYSVGLREDLQALITRGAAQAAAKAHVRQVNLEILWQEWQVAGRARQLFIQTRADQQLRRVLTQTRALLAKRYHNDEAALRRGDALADTVSADVRELTAADTQLRQLQLQINQTRHALNELLGLEADARLLLIGRFESRSLSKAQFQTAVAALPHRRADLLALQAGYESQEQRLREAILAQFPAMSAGVEQARSAEEGIHTIGFTVDLTLPLFNRNRGQIAIRRATREVLRQTYQVRLDEAVNQADQVWRAARIMARHVRRLETHRRGLEARAAAAGKSFRRGNLDEAGYVQSQSGVLSEQETLIRLRAALAQSQSALKILLGLPFHD